MKLSEALEAHKKHLDEISRKRASYSKSSDKGKDDVLHKNLDDKKDK